jgi:hypothetical protein
MYLLLDPARLEKFQAYAEQLKNKLEVVTNYYSCNSDKIVYLTDIDEIIKRIDNRYKIGIETFNNKKLFYEYAVSKGLTEYVPETYFEPPKIFPAIMKPIIGIGGRGIRVFRNRPDYVNSPVKYDQRYLVQKFINNNQQNRAHLLVKNGKIVKGLVYSEQATIRYGPVQNYVTRQLTQDELDVFGRFVEIYRGPCCVDYTYLNKTIKIFEINPRFGESLVSNRTDFLDFIDTIIATDLFYSHTVSATMLHNIIGTK